MSSLMLKDDPYLESGKFAAIPLTGYPLDFRLTPGGIYVKGRNHYRLVKKFWEYMKSKHVVEAEKADWQRA